jgi:TPP-dependent pyruvate/acetoin dehydrogenase alpha subunit
MLYRAKDEVARQRETMDCLKNFRARVTAEGWLSDAELDSIDAGVLGLIDACVARARTAAPPTSADLLTDVYVSY